MKKIEVFQIKLRKWFKTNKRSFPWRKNNLSSYKILITEILLQKTKAESENSWSIDVKKIDQTTFDLSAKNPNKKEEAALRQPQEILEEMKALDEESSLLMDNLQLIIDNGR